MVARSKKKVRKIRNFTADLEARQADKAKTVSDIEDKKCQDSRVATH